MEKLNKSLLVGRRDKQKSYKQRCVHSTKCILSTACVFLALKHQIDIFCKKKEIIQYIHHICQTKSCMLFMQLSLNCAFSCGSSTVWTVYRNSCTACMKRASIQNVKACDTSCYWSLCKRSCTVYMHRGFLQYV